MNLSPPCGPVAAMGVGERGRRDQQAAGARHDLALLEQEFGFAVAEAVVEVQRPQQVPVQRLAPRIARIQLAMPVRIAAAAGGVPLQVDRAGAQAGLHQRRQRRRRPSPRRPRRSGAAARRRRRAAAASAARSAPAGSAAGRPAGRANTAWLSAARPRAIPACRRCDRSRLSLSSGNTPPPTRPGCSAPLPRRRATIAAQLARSSASA